MSDGAYELDRSGDPQELAELLARVDADGLLRETAAGAVAATRGGFLRRLAGGGAMASLAALLTAAGAEATARTRTDVAMLRFDLVLEYLQAGLYTEAERLGNLSPKTLDWARVVGAHERAHARAIKTLLGGKAVPSPSFDYGSVTSNEQAFIRTAVAFEDLTAALLKWQAPRLDSRSILAAVATLHSVETRHAAWIRHIVGLPPATGPFDKPASQQKMAALIASTHFISKSAPRMSSRERPKLTG
jgi:ferritin-like protein